MTNRLKELIQECNVPPIKVDTNISICLAGASAAGKTEFLKFASGSAIDVVPTTEVKEVKMVGDLDGVTIYDLPPIDHPEQYEDIVRKYVSECDIVVSFISNRRGGVHTSDLRKLVDLGLFNRDFYPVLLNVTNYEYAAISGDVGVDVKKDIQFAVKTLGLETLVKVPISGSLRTFHDDNIYQFSWKNSKDQTKGELMGILSLCKRRVVANRKIFEYEKVLIKGNDTAPLPGYLNLVPRRIVVPFPLVVVNATNYVEKEKLKPFLGKYKFTNVYDDGDTVLEIPHFRMMMRKMDLTS